MAGSMKEQVRLPPFIKRAHEVPDKRDVIGAHRSPSQCHAGLVRSAITFHVIALDASTDEVVPGILPTT